MSRLSQPEIGTLRRLLSKGIARMHHMKNGTELHLCQSVAKLRSLDPLNHVLNSQGDGGPDSANRPPFHWKRHSFMQILSYLGFPESDDPHSIADTAYIILATKKPFAERQNPSGQEIFDRSALPTRFCDTLRSLLKYRQESMPVIPVSLRKITSWNLNSWIPGHKDHLVKTKVILQALKKGPVCLQETKWSQEQAALCSERFRGHSLAHELSRGIVHREGGVATLLPAGWKAARVVRIVEHCCVAVLIAAVSSPFWLVNLYARVEWTREDFIMFMHACRNQLKDAPVILCGDINRVDHKFPQLWEDFLQTMSLEDISPSLETFWHPHGKSKLDRFLVSTTIQSTAQVYIKLSVRPPLSNFGHGILACALTHRPRLAPDPSSVKHEVVPTEAFVSSRLYPDSHGEVKLQHSLLELRRDLKRIAGHHLATAERGLLQSVQATVWSWWKSNKDHLCPDISFRSLYKGLQKNIRLLHVPPKILAALVRVSQHELLAAQWPVQSGCSLIPTNLIQEALKNAEVNQLAASSLVHPTGHSNPILQSIASRNMWDRLKLVCPKGSFYNGPILDACGNTVITASDYDQAMLSTRDFWMHAPIDDYKEWAYTLDTYASLVQPWPAIPPPSESDYVKQLLHTKDSHRAQMVYHMRHGGTPLTLQ